MTINSKVESSKYPELGIGKIVCMLGEKATVKFDGRYITFPLSELIERKAKIVKKNLKFIPPNIEDSMRIISILQNDPKFSLPISAPPKDEEEVKDEIEDVEKGLTIASHRKLHVSYDIVYSSNAELESLLLKSGIYSRPFFNSIEVCLAHGPRRNFYMYLLESGFVPSHVSKN